MSKPVIVTLVVLVGLVLAFPLLGLLGGRNGAPRTDDLIPGVEEAPPKWDAQRLAGTSWQADMRTSPTSKYRDEVLFQYRFLPGHQVTLDIVDMEEPDPEKSEESLALRQHLRDALMPQFKGTYRVDGSRITLEVEMLGKAREDIIEIRGGALYYHAVQMNQINE